MKENNLVNVDTIFTVESYLTLIEKYLSIHNKTKRWNKHIAITSFLRNYSYFSYKTKRVIKIKLGNLIDWVRGCPHMMAISKMNSLQLADL